MWNKNSKKCHLFINYKSISILANLRLGCPGIWVARLWIINKQVAFLQILVRNNYCFLILKHLDTMSNVTDCVPCQTDLWGLAEIWPCFFGVPLTFWIILHFEKTFWLHNFFNSSYASHLSWGIDTCVIHSSVPIWKSYRPCLRSQ